MKDAREWIENWLSLIALCAFAGFMACVNHVPFKDITAKRFFINMAGSILIGVIAVLMLDGISWTDKQKLGAAVLAGYMATPLLHGFYKLAEVFQKDPEKWIKRK
jgi:hypothetical protein